MAHWKRSAIRQALLVMVPVTGWDYWHHPSVTIAALSELAAIYAAWYGWRGLRRFWPLRHYWQWVRPFTHTLQAELGVSPQRLAIEPDRSRVLMVLPPEFLGSDHERAAITKAVEQKVGVIEPQATWRLQGRSHEVEFTQNEPPPLRVYPRHVVPAIQAAKEHEIAYGAVRGGDVLIRSLDQDSPHCAWCMPSGDGKSTAIRNVVCQHLYHGGIAFILDIKMFSHMWCDGLPNVVYAYTPQMVHQALCWLADDDEQESELTYRKRIGRRHADIRGNIQTDLGPRILVVAEEQNDTAKELKKLWRKMGGKGTSPAVDAMDSLSFTGRQLKMHVAYVGQRLSAKATGGGSADSRENIGLWVFSNPKDSTWKLLGEGYAKPPGTDHKGRYHLLESKGLTPFQSVYWTEEEARAFATSGTIGQPHRDLPFTRHVGSVAGHAIEPGAPDQGIVIGQPPVLTRPPSSATIREFLDAGAFGRTTIAAARKRVQRAGIESVGTEGKDHLYPIERLKELVR